MPPKRKSIRNPTGQNGYVLPQEKLEQREKAFTIYRDMGPARSIGKLVAELKDKHPEIAASRPTIENWSSKHDWGARCKAHDAAMMAGRTQLLQESPILGLDPNFDQVGALLQAANQALTRAMNATPIVTKPSDVKALVDAASNALKLIETIKNQSTGKVSREEVAREMARVLDLVREARFRDIDELVKAELAKRGIEAEPEAKSASNGEAIAVEHDELETDAPPELTNGREKPETTAEPCQPTKTGVRRFTEVVAEMRAAADIAAEN